eukprot:2040015-Alexandrium_andersonii.AAC.1
MSIRDPARELMGFGQVPSRGSVVTLGRSDGLEPKRLRAASETRARPATANAGAKKNNACRLLAPECEP